jgi:hypothetical protein
MHPMLMAWAGAESTYGRRKQFFFEKKNQKTFESWAEPLRKDRSQTCKSFLLLFFKKEVLPKPAL